MKPSTAISNSITTMKDFQIMRKLGMGLCER